jgi:WD40 repeat protein
VGLDASAAEWTVPLGPKPLARTTLPCGAYGLSFAPDGERLAFALEDGSVEIRRRNGIRLERFEAHAEACYCVAWSPDGERLASGARDGSVAVRDLATGKVQAGDPHGDMTLSCVWSRDGARLATTSRDRTTRLRDREGRLVRALVGHRLSVWAADFDADGRRVATSSFDQSVRIFDVATGAELRVLEGHTREVSTLVWEPRGRILTGSRDGTLRAWDPETGEARVVRPGAELDAHDG